MKEFLVGGLAGAGVAIVVWLVVSTEIDKQLAQGGQAMLTSAERQLQAEALRIIRTEVPQRVRDGVQSKLNEYGLTPAVGARVRTLLSRGESLGLFGIG